MSAELEFKFRYQEKKSANEEKYDKCKDRFFLVFNWLTVVIITSFSFFTGVSQINLSTWNMTQYCEDEKFNQPLSPLTKKWAVATILLLITMIVAVMSLHMFMCNKIGKDVLNIVNFFVGFLLSWDVTYILQNMLSFPIPSYYQNNPLKWYYCCKNCPQQEFTLKLEELDLQTRGSFPSFLMCGLSYTTTFFYLYTCYLDKTKNFAGRIITLIIPGLICTVYGLLLWKNNENHFEDVAGGTCIGTFLAVYIMKWLFIKNDKFDRFTDDFISVLMTREIELADLNSTENSNHEGRARVSEYTINLCSHATSPLQPSAPVEDQPPPYASI